MPPAVCRLSVAVTCCRLMKASLRLVLFGSALAFCCVAAEKFSYPTPPANKQCDDYFGTKVADPFRPLEDLDAPATRKWIEEENKVTFDYLAKIPERKQINARLTALWNYEKFGTPYHEGGNYFFSKNSGLQNQSVLYVASELPGEPRALIDPNTLSSDGTVALSGTAVAQTGELLAYALARAGSDWQEWKVRDISSGKDLNDDLKWSKFSNASWDHEGTGFFYSRYDTPTGEELKRTNYFHKLYYHKIGTAQEQDPLVYERKDHKDWLFNGSVTDDGQYLIINVSQGTDPKNRVFYKHLRQPDAKVVELLNKQDASYNFIDNDGPVFWFRTDLNAPRGRIVAIDLGKPEEMKELIPQTVDKLENVSAVGDRFVADYLKDAHSVVKLFELNGKPAGEIPLPGLGSAAGFSGKRKDSETFYSFVSFIDPPTIYRY